MELCGGGGGGEGSPLGLKNPPWPAGLVVDIIIS